MLTPFRSRPSPSGTSRASLDYHAGFKTGLQLIRIYGVNGPKKANAGDMIRLLQQGPTKTIYWWNGVDAALGDPDMTPDRLDRIEAMIKKRSRADRIARKLEKARKRDLRKPHELRPADPAARRRIHRAEA